MSNNATSEPQNKRRNNLYRQTDNFVDDDNLQIQKGKVSILFT